MFLYQLFLLASFDNAFCFIDRVSCGNVGRANTEPLNFVKPLGAGGTGSTDGGDIGIALYSLIGIFGIECLVLGYFSNAILSLYSATNVTVYPVLSANPAIKKTVICIGFTLIFACQLVIE